MNQTSTLTIQDIQDELLRAGIIHYINAHIIENAMRSLSTFSTLSTSYDPFSNLHDMCSEYVNWFFWSAYKKGKPVVKNRCTKISTKSNIMLNRKMMHSDKIIYIKNKRRIKKW